MGQSRQTVGKSQNWCLFAAKSMSYALYTYLFRIIARFGSYQTIKPLYNRMANVLILRAFACFGSYQTTCHSRQTTKSQTTIQYSRLTDEEKPAEAGYVLRDYNLDHFPLDDFV